MLSTPPGQQQVVFIVWVPDMMYEAPPYKTSTFLPLNDTTTAAGHKAHTLIPAFLSAQNKERLKSLRIDWEVDHVSPEKVQDERAHFSKGLTSAARLSAYWF